ncbi:tRNA epoxyqueuosine(34) reductase QueG [Paenimyroides tangerinum]|uniref:Epoxyqueuosine reductase n=1 Tax=Paenimyroides tangerinum TaxID=2488728 RepID=A0A3P3WFT5_9FLAO|nr:tRNA epoxyqueuosine(34) reductase QueG [Paenimyroides tangerinum]RRJ93298.1 tRNA epoxyqueuosine(34) reductase QueG [Paenimyroides tangerinum]
MQNRTKHTQMIKKEAERLGFLSCGISKAEFLESEAPRLEKWLSNNMHGEMIYMENYFDKRLDPRLLVDGAKTVISLLMNYYPSQFQVEDSYKLSKYAYGRDYHGVIKKRMSELTAFIRNNIGEINSEIFIDSAPVLDKAWAVKSGLGWMGKNTNLISKKTGSFFFIAEIICDLDLDYDTIVTDHCGSCTACIDACPTQAIEQPYVVNGSKCISYFTIELQNQIPKEMKGKLDDWMYGCDVCQDVCPWNRFSKPHNEPLFEPRANLLELTKQDWNALNKEIYNKVFKKSAVKRIKFEGLVKNIEFIKEVK